MGDTDMPTLECKVSHLETELQRTTDNYNAISTQLTALETKLIAIHEFQSKQKSFVAGMIFIVSALFTAGVTAINMFMSYKAGQDGL
jgi:septal ring factor EnvC (AmiA/AmiB activator)